MKKVKDDITTADKGMEIGLSFENFRHGSLQVDDIIECYRDVEEQKIKKFNRRAGVFF